MGRAWHEYSLRKGLTPTSEERAADYDNFFLKCIQVLEKIPEAIALTGHVGLK